MAGEVTSEPDAPLPATVVIATRGRPGMLLDTVESIVAARRVPHELVVVDQSPEPHPELAGLGTRRGCKVRYVHSPVPGASRARNIGLRHASQDTVVMLDDDILVSEDSLELLLAAREGRDGRIVTTGRLLAAPAEGPGLRQPPGALVTRTEAEVFRGRQPRQVVPGPNVAIPLDVMLEIGGYDERLGPGTRFPSAEDHDLSLRLLDAGCEVRHVPEAVVLHRAWRTRREIVRLRWGYARGVGAFYAKHASLRDRHTLERAGREVSARARRAVRSLFSRPATSARELLTLA
ncbi:MAG TPA: glycosyltransferase, partial [Thermoleophilaceae bacterium]|nr:glycosyltransferase [Thermoleophilaceae bacterium]